MLGWVSHEKIWLCWECWRYFKAMIRGGFSFVGCSIVWRYHFWSVPWHKLAEPWLWVIDGCSDWQLQKDAFAANRMVLEENNSGENYTNKHCCLDFLLVTLASFSPFLNIFVSWLLPPLIEVSFHPFRLLHPSVWEDVACFPSISLHSDMELGPFQATQHFIQHFRQHLLDLMSRRFAVYASLFVLYLYLC